MFSPKVLFLPFTLRYVINLELIFLCVAEV